MFEQPDPFGGPPLEDRGRPRFHLRQCLGVIDGRAFHAPFHGPDGGGLVGSKASTRPRVAARMRLTHRIWVADIGRAKPSRSEEHTSELQSLMRISYALFCLKKKYPRMYYTIY